MVRAWYKNGQLENEGNFVNGNPKGLFTSWYPNGKIESQQKF